ncbi:MAG: DUF4258 domain-containing protein [Thermodesulfobacteriota bacterium]|nr:DUF4258 domain-containing protein [Thermodesulfobacteriota bacterium]
MNHEQLKDIIQNNRIEWSAHALTRMLEKGISRASVKHIIINGEIIESYSEDKPLPNGLFYGSWEDMILHVVIAYDAASQKIFVITAYWPDEEHFESDFRTRRK